jgi:3-oxoacyl-[acyl-carrier-protein] synthase III
VMFGISGSGITVGTGLYRFDDLPDRLRALVQPTNGEADGAPRLADRPAAAPRRVRRSLLDRRLTKAVVAGVGTALPSSTTPKIMELSLAATRAALAESGVSPTDIGLLTYTGIYRDEYLSEPAFAAMLADKLRLHDPAAADHPPFFSFDLLNGSLGFLQACYLTAQRIQCGRITAGIIATAEVEPQPAHLLGLAAAGGAFLLRSTPHAGDDAAGFGDFVFRNDWSKISARTAALAPTVGPRFDPRIDLATSPDLHASYAELLADAIEELRDRRRLTWDDIGCVLSPRISPTFLQSLTTRLPQLRDKLLCDETLVGDSLTCSLPLAWEAARRAGALKAGTTGLLLAVGAGLQAGCASYHWV